MNRVPTLCGALLLILGLNGCATNCGLEPEPCETRQLATTSLEAEYGCTSSRWLGLSGGSAPIIIRTQAEFDQQVSGECHPQIDFARYDLIIGQQPQLGGAASASATYTYRRDVHVPAQLLPPGADVAGGVEIGRYV